MIRTDVSMPYYLCLEALSSGVAFEAISRSPLHARYKQLNSDRWSKKADLGTVVHQMLLEGHSDCVVWLPEEFTDFRKKEAQVLRDAAYAEGKTPMLAGQKGECERMLNTVREQIAGTELAEVLGTGHPEVTVEWTDQGIACKARPDYLTDKFHISVKTTAASGEPNSFNRRVLTPGGYDFSLMFYDRGLRAEGWEGEHRLLVIEQEPPYCVSVIALSGSKRVIAETDVDRAIKLWAKCLEQGKFPGYGDTFWAEATPWEIAAAEEREAVAIGARA
jgi:hypothetical protein